MIIYSSVDATPLQIQPPFQSKPPKIVNWFITDEGLKHIYIQFSEKIRAPFGPAPLQESSRPLPEMILMISSG